MSGQYYAGAYWAEREETASGCAERLHACLAGLAELDDALSGWRRTGPSPRAAQGAPVGTDVVSLGGLVTPGSDGRYVDPSAIEGLGFSVGLWNGDTRRSIGLQITCGAIVPRVSNVFTLQLPDNGQLCSWLPWPKARRLMEILVSSFEPDWATLTSHEWRPAQGAIPPQHVVGWLTYLTDVPAAALVSAGEVEQFAEGTLVTAGKACDESLGDRVQRLAASLQEMRR